MTLEVISLDKAVLESHEEEGSIFLPKYREITEEAINAVRERKGLIYFEGPLGSGKSTLAEIIARQLGITAYIENAEDSEIKRYLSMLYSNEKEIQCVGAAGVNNRYTSMRMYQYEHALKCAQSVALDRTPTADDIYMECFIEDGLMTPAQVKDIQERRAAEIKILRSNNSRTRPIEVMIQLTGGPDVFYRRKNKRARGSEIEENGKGVPLAYIQRLTKRYEKLPQLLEASGFHGPIVQINQEVKTDVDFNPASGNHILPVLDYLQKYFNSCSI